MLGMCVISLVMPSSAYFKLHNRGSGQCRGCIPDLCSIALLAPLPWISLASVLTLAAVAFSGSLPCSDAHVSINMEAQ